MGALMLPVKDFCDLAQKVCRVAQGEKVSISEAFEKAFEE
jgi:hypothetical protein